MHHLGLLSENILFFLHPSRPVTKLNQLTLPLKKKAIFYHSRYEPNNYTKLQISGTSQINIVLGAKERHSTKDVAVAVPAARLRSGK